MIKQKILLSLICALITIVVIGCGKKPEPQKDSILIGTFSRAIDYSPFYVARHFRWFEDNPDLRSKKINYNEFTDRSLISAALANHTLDAVFAAEPPMIITEAAGDEVRIVEVSCTLQQEIVVRSDLPINTVAGLRGRIIAVLQTTSSEYGLRKILEANDLDFQRDVNIQYMGPDVAKAAFESDRIDAWAVWPPFVEEQQVGGRGRVLSGGDAVIQSVMALPPSLITEHEKIATALVSVIQQAKNWIEQNPQEAQTIVANELSLDPMIVKTAWGKHNWKATLTDDVIRDIQEKANFLADAGATRNSRKLDVRNELMNFSFVSK